MKIDVTIEKKENIMLAEAYIENDEMRIINFPKNVFKGKHWKVNIEPIEEIKDEIIRDDFISSIVLNPVNISTDISFLSRTEANER